jgi:DNA topoisomerase-3
LHSSDSFYSDVYDDGAYTAGPTEKQVAFANRLASERGVRVPAEAAASSVAMSQFIDTCLQQPVGGGSAASSGYMGGGMGGGTKPPSDKQIAFAARLAGERGLAIPPEAMADSGSMSQFIDSALSRYK